MLNNNGSWNARSSKVFDEGFTKWLDNYDDYKITKEVLRSLCSLYS